jgi:hypothetical protein
MNNNEKICKSTVESNVSFFGKHKVDPFINISIPALYSLHALAPEDNNGNTYVINRNIEGESFRSDKPYVAEMESIINNGYNTPIWHSRNVSGKKITYCMDIAGVPHRYYNFIIGCDANNTYSYRNYKWFLSLFGTDMTLSWRSSRISGMTPQYGERRKYVICVDHSSGDYEIWASNGDYAKGARSRLTYSTSKFQLGSFNSFSSYYAGKSYIHEFVMSDGFITVDQREWFLDEDNR